MMFASRIIWRGFERCDEKQFFRGTASTEAQIVCIFASNTQLDLLSASSALQVDATYKVAPRQFCQMFTLFVVRQQYLFPVYFIRMTWKTKDLYNAVFNEHTSQLPDIAPVHIMADFQDASVLAFKEVYGSNMQANECWFHFAEAVVRKANKIALNSAFRDDAEARKCIPCVTCLSLLPSNDTDSALTDLELFLPGSSNRPLLRRLLYYVRRSWLTTATISISRYLRFLAVRIALRFTHDFRTCV